MNSAGSLDPHSESGFSHQVFRSDKELASFGSTSLYGQSAGLGNIAIQQRSLSAAFQRNATPTSMGATNFALGLQTQQPPQPSQGQISPNRSLLLGQRGILNHQVPSQGGLNSQLKRVTPTMSSGLISAAGNAINSSPLLSAFNRSGDANQPSLDLSEFPTLGNRGSQPNQMSAPRNYVGMVSKPSQEPAAEFQIQQEDFPALPGAQSSTDSSRKTPTSTGTLDNSLKDANGKFPGDKSSGGQTRGIQTHPDGTVSNIPADMVSDQFGMVGLLTFIRAAESDPNLVALAPGIDLTTLGLNLNSPENLYSTFQSPWADAPCRPQDIDFHVPSEYLTNVYIRDKLAPIKFNRYQEDLLFFLFYMNGGDVLQLAAAAELYTRDWRYHKEERVWLTRAPGMEPVVKTTHYERGTYYYFDVQNWRKVAKEFYVEYDKLEERPHLPFLPALLQQSQMTH